MVSSSSLIQEGKSMLAAFARQPYIYGYRTRLFIYQYALIQKLLKKHITRKLKRAQREVTKVDDLTIESIRDNSVLSDNHASYLYALTRFLKPHIVVETGVGFGESAYFILQALQDNGSGELYSIDYPRSSYPSDAGIQIDESSYTSQDDKPGRLIPDHLRKHWTLLLGKSSEKLPSLCKNLGTIDLFFHDSEHTYLNMMREYETVWPHLREKGILASHDIDWNSAFEDFAQRHNCDTVNSRNRFGFIIQ
jgi:predicted O-methyltransferase YrrM